MRTLLAVACGSLGLLFVGSAQAAEQAERLVWVELPSLADKELVQTLGFGWDEGQQGTRFRLRVPEDRLDELDRSGLSWTPAPVYLQPEGYRSPSELRADLEDLVASEPGLLQLVEIGRSIEGRPLVGVRVFAGDRPHLRQRVLGAHHGDESASAELTLALTEALVEAWREGDPDVSTLLDEQELFLLPLVNPDGYAEHTRYNARGVDLNRNYGHEWSASSSRGGDAPFSEPETRAVRAWSTWSGYGAGLSLHSGAVNIGWVWNFTTTRTAEDRLLDALAQTYADECEVDGFYTTNGADWYVTHGDTTDWAYGRLGTLDFTLELSQRKAPEADTLDSLFAEHHDGMLAFLLWSDTVSLVIRDAETGLGMPAEITLLDGGWPSWSASDGVWGRPVLEPGGWTAEVRAPGYESVVVELLTTSPGEPVDLQREELASWLPEDRVLSRGGAGRLVLPDDVLWLGLTRPGEEEVVAGQDSDGAWLLDLDALSAGAWTLETDQGVVPRGLFVGELDDAVTLSAGWMDGTELELSGSGFGQGSRLWALWGEHRAPVELVVVEETSESVIADASGLPPDTEVVDLLLLSNGYELGLADLHGAAVVDTAAPEDTGLTGDSGTASSDGGQAGSGSGGGGGAVVPATPSRCGCASTGASGYPALLGILCVASLLFRRRQT